MDIRPNLHHNRYPNVSVLTQNESVKRRPRANTITHSSLQTLVDAFNHLSDEDKKGFSRFAELQPRHASESPQSPLKRKASKAATVNMIITNEKRALSRSSSIMETDKRPILRSHTTRITDQILISRTSTLNQSSLNVSEKIILELPYKEDIYRNEFVYKIFIGNTAAANDETLLRNHLIEAILVLGSVGSLEKFTSVKRGYLRLEVEDDLMKIMDSAQRFLDIHLTKCHVLVVCTTGLKLSPAVVIGYIVKRFGIIYSYAKDYVSRNVPGIELNPEHVKQLKFMGLNKTE